MSTVLVVTRRRTLPIELRRQGFDVREAASHEGLDGGLRRGDVGAVVIDLPTQEETALTLRTLAELAEDVPAVALAGQSDPLLPPSSLSHLVVHLRMPATASQVATVIRDLVDHASRSPGPVVPGEAAEALPPDVSDATETDPDVDLVLDADGELEVYDEPAATVVPPDRWTSSVPKPRVALDDQATLPDVPVGNGHPRRWALRRPGGLRGATTGRDAGRSWRSAVQIVLDGLPDLGSLQEILGGLLDDALEQTRAKAGAALLADDGTWAVAAERGLRPAERRLVLSRDHWLVRQLRHRPLVLLVGDTDDARGDLAGVPLASWESFLAFPAAGGDALVLLARDDGPFSVADVRRLPSTLCAFEPLVHDGLLARRLARALEPLS